MNAETLLWQARLRRALVALLVVGMLALKSRGVLSSDSVLARDVGQGAALLAAGVLAVLYLAWIQLQMHWLDRHRQSNVDAMVVANVVADMLLLFGVMFCTSPADEYHRALIVSVFTVQLTQLSFGVRATIYNLACVGLFYTILVAVATSADAIVSPAEVIWDFALYLIGSLIFVSLHWTMTRRLERIVHVFDRAQDGDFSHEYDVALDRMPDAITMVGRAYNRMRGKLEAVVLTDSLSGCYNRRGFDQMVARELARAVRGGHVTAILALDIDHFKTFNDRFGHAAGDQVLKRIAGDIMATVRATDHVFRFGGEEFVVICDGLASEPALALGERIRRVIASSGEERERVTVSIGIATCAGEALDYDALFLIADKRLYQAKAAGRNCVIGARVASTENPVRLAVSG